MTSFLKESYMEDDTKVHKLPKFLSQAIFFLQLTFYFLRSKRKYWFSENFQLLFFDGVTRFAMP